MTDFESDAQRDVYERLTQWLSDRPDAAPVDGRPSFRVGEIFIGVVDWGDIGVWLNFVSWPKLGTEASAGAGHRLAAANREQLIGAFALMEDRDVAYRYAALAEGVSKDEFAHMLMAYERELAFAGNKLSMILLD